MSCILSVDSRCCGTRRYGDDNVSYTLWSNSAIYGHIYQNKFNIFLFPRNPHTILNIMMYAELILLAATRSLSDF